MKMRPFLILLLSCTSTTTWAQKGIELNTEPAERKNADYFVSKVTDTRKDTTKIGYIRAAGAKEKEPLVFNEGLATTLLKHFNSDTSLNPDKTPVELVVLELEVKDKKKRGDPLATIRMKYAFKIEGKQELALDAEFETYGSTDAIAKGLSKQTEKISKQFGRWFEQNKEKILAKPSISVGVTVISSTKDKHRIMYTKRRKLTYSDFQRRPKRVSKYAAETASGIVLETSGLVFNKQVVLKLSVGAAMYKKSSWFKKKSKTRYVLDHEQLHFDVTAYCACELVQALKQYNFTPEHYDKELDKLYRQYQDKLGRVQDQYDGETDHGLIKEKQADWRQKINELLAAQDCYK